MALLKDDDKKEVERLLAGLENEVRLVMFTQEVECQYCEVTREMVEEIAALSPKITAEIHDFVADADFAKEYGIDKIPAIAVVGERDYGIRFYGVPAGYEFTSLIEDILDVGRGDPGLPADVTAQLSQVDKPVHMQVMITPT